MKITLTHYKLENPYSHTPYPVQVEATNICGFIMDTTVFDTFQKAYDYVQASEVSVKEYRDKFPKSDLGDRNYTVNIHPEQQPE